jgi:ferredoxin
MGTWRLADQIDSSHRFFYAHRYWPQVKLAVQNAEAPFAADLAELASAVATAAARRARVDREFLLGISAAALMTYRQVGAEAFTAAPGRIHLSEKARAMSPHQVLKKRARDDSQGLLGFVRGPHKRWTVTFDEGDPEATFTAINGQEIATAAQTDKRDYKSREPRCTPGEGPIPVECRAASCGTCWVGVLGGAEKLSPVVDRDERRRMAVFGYTDSTEERPLIRLACQARAFGAVSLVIPPWNGLIGSCRASRQ